MITNEPKFKGHFDVYGSGFPVLCLSGLGCSNWIFRPMAESLSTQFQMVLPDNRGMGRSPYSESAYSIEDLATDALALMDDLGHETFAVIGISMGGFIGMTLTLMAPGRVKGLVLLCTTGPGPRFHPIPVLSDELLESSYRMPATDRIRANTQVTTYPGFEHRDPDRWEWILKHKIDNIADLQQLRYQNKAAKAFISTQLELERINCPGLIMSGRDDRFVDPDNARILGDVIGHSRVVIIPQSDHLFFLEKSDQVNREIATFLEQL